MNVDRIMNILKTMKSLLLQRDKADIPVTQRPILPALAILSFPIIVGELMQLAYKLVDTLWVGRLGTEELAAMSFAFPIIFVVISLGAGFSISGSALVSQYTGAEQSDQANHAAGQVLIFGTSISTFLTILGLLYGRSALQMLGPEPEVLELAWAYFRILCAAIPLIFIYFIFQATYRAIGDTVTPMLIKLFSVGLNVILDPLLIFGIGPFPYLGITGAAWATVFSRLLATIIGLYLLFTSYRGGLHLQTHHLIPDFQVILKIIKIGAPAAASMTALALARTFMTGIVGSFGTATMAAWGVVNRVMSVFRLPAMGTSRATTILVGQHLGAHQVPRAEKTAWTSTAVTFGSLFALGLVGLLVAPFIITIFDSTPDVVRIGTEYLRIAIFAYVFLGIQQVLCGGLRGAGNTVEDAAIRIITQWGMQIPFAYYLSSIFGRIGIWWAVLLSYFLGAGLSIVWFRRGTWQETVIDDPTPETGEFD